MKKVRSEKRKNCLTVYHFTVIHVMKVSVFSLGSQEVRHGASGVQQPPLRKYGGMRNLSVSSKPVLFQGFRESKGSIFLLIEGFQARHMDLMQLVIGENGIQCNVRSQLSLIIVEGQYSEANSD